MLFVEYQAHLDREHSSSFEATLVLGVLDKDGEGPVTSRSLRDGEYGKYRCLYLVFLSLILLLA